MIITVDYGTHEYDEEWVPTSYFCPHCGEQSVYQDLGGDYYVGSLHLCLGCHYQFYIPDCTPPDEYSRQRLEQILLNGGSWVEDC